MSLSSGIMQNITISVPAGTYYLASRDVYCVPNTWYNIVEFFLVNYFAHAATVKSLPGEPTVSTLVSIFFTLLFPSTGVIRAVAAIRQCTFRYSDPLQAATRAGALCMVVRTKRWKPRDGDEIHGLQRKSIKRDKSMPHPDSIDAVQGPEPVTIELPQESDDLPSRAESGESPGYILERTMSSLLKVDTKKKAGRNIFHPSIGALSFSGRKVFGTCCLPEGYGLMIVPSNRVVVGLDDQPSKKDKRRPYTNESYNKSSPFRSTPKTLIAIVQILYASFALYRTRGNQIDKYGYAAFGLTVTPYLIMSIVNLASSLLTSDYASVFLVHSDILDEAKNRGGSFDGIVGKLKVLPGQPNDGTFAARFNNAADGLTMQQLPASNGEDEARETLPLQALSSNSDPNASMRTTIVVPAFSPVEKLKERAIGPDYILPIILTGSITIGIVGGLSRFRKANSTHPQRVWIVCWLFWSAYMGPYVHAILNGIYRVDYGAGLKSSFLYVIFYLVYCAPAIGGFVVVGQMLSEYGKCYRTY